MIRPAGPSERPITLDELQQQPEEHLRRLRETGKPATLSIAGERRLVVQDAEAYECLLDELDRLEAIEGIRQGLQSMARGEGRPMREFMEELASKHGINLKP